MSQEVKDVRESVYTQGPLSGLNAVSRRGIQPYRHQGVLIKPLRWVCHLVRGVAYVPCFSA